MSSPLARGEAGPQGPDVRSDLHVTFESGPNTLEVVVRSRVAPYYGEAIETQARDVLRGLGVTHGRLTIDDQGALPFVIAARIEAALRAAGLVEGLGYFPFVSRPALAGKGRLRRSRLYLPGSEPKYMINAGLHSPDGVILDLEDSVHPDDKAAARILVRNALAQVDFNRAERMVRINQVPLGLTDLRAVIPALPDLILIPKVESPEQIVLVDGLIKEILLEVGRPYVVGLMPILESALGIERAFEIATATPGVVALTIGLEDYTADLGVVKTREGAESLYARRRVVNAARAAGVQAIDSVYGDVDDVEGLLAWGLRSRGMGFEGMGCVHPRQIEIIHHAFAPSPEEIEKARRIAAAFEEAKARGKGVVSLGSKMIDPPVVERAVRLIERARAMGLISETETAEEQA